MSAEEFEIRPASELNPQQVDALMRKIMSQQRADFLRDYGHWKHRGQENRFVVRHRDSGELAGYSASIPVEILVHGETFTAVWLVDLFILPEYRGRGLQHQIDIMDRALSTIQLSFPNPTSAHIHKKHGSGVREDYRVQMLPLRVHALPHLERFTGWKRRVARIGTTLMMPVLCVYKAWLMRQPTPDVERLDDPDPAALATIFQHNNQYITVNRDAAYLRWRYLESPHRDEYRFYQYHHSLVLITRTYIRKNGAKITRILDVFGDFSQRKGLMQLVRAATQDAIRQEAIYITALRTDTAWPEATWHAALRRYGFLLGTVSRFRWKSEDPALFQAIATQPCLWCLADSDNDTID